MNIDEIRGSQNPPVNLVAKPGEREGERAPPRQDAPSGQTLRPPVADARSSMAGKTASPGGHAVGRSGLYDGAPAGEAAAPGLVEAREEAGGPVGGASGASHLTKRQKRRRRKVGEAAAALSAARPGATGAPLPAAPDPSSIGAPSAEPARKTRRHKRKGGRRVPQAEALPQGAPRAMGPAGARAAGPAAAAFAEAPPALAVQHRLAPASAPRAPGAAGAASPLPFVAVRASSLALPEAERTAPPPVYAALDLGTNNCRLLVAVPTRPGQFRVVDAFSRIVRLGEGLGRTGRLAAPAMDRAIGALAICAQKLSARTVVGARLIATEACRAAANGEEFIERVRRETGLDLEIVSRETEARLAVSGCGSLVDRSAEGAVLFDIGGGSTEIALLDLRGGPTRRLSNHIVAWTSLPVGVVSLAESHGGRDVGPDLFEAMIEEVLERIGRFPGRGRLDDLVGGPAFHLLGTSGTVTTLAGVHLGLERYDRRQVDGLWLTDAEVTELVARIAGWSFEERVANPCIGSDRADLVLAGCAILEAIRRVWPARSLRVADRGLREGLLTEMMVADGVWRKGAPVRPKAMA